MELHRIKKKPNDYFVSPQSQREKKYVTLEPNPEPNPEPNESRFFLYYLRHKNNIMNMYI